MPDTVELKVTSTTEGGVSDFASLYPSLAPRGDAEQPYRVVRFQASRIDREAFLGGHCQKARLQASHVDPAPAHRYSRDFTFKCDSPVNDLMRALFKGIGVRHIASLSIIQESFARLAGPVLSTEILDTFRYATDLHTLKAVGGAAAAVCSALAANVEGEAGRDSGAVMWPRLRDLLDNSMGFLCHLVDGGSNVGEAVIKDT
ncbi:hypothetical protein FA95DRAFT_1611980 [Auriscalpium vulgare]|uniref:Uncharacterized protein n=1 Tax=Auriscalpium vulgare TaxID=40419 RepID=A0ACB8R9F2_9AGAM|nr:hypothetical protein FA95DRAFT_1611980 [Auriscalpium vulgare]